MELEAIRLLERQLLGHLAALDVDIIGRETAKTIILIKRTVGDARLDIRDYELADSRAEMLAYAAAARKRLGRLRSYILAASEHGIFSPIEVAELSVHIDSLEAALAGQG